MRVAFAVASVSLAACGLSVVGVDDDGATDGGDAAGPVVDAAPSAVADATMMTATDSGAACVTVTDTFATVDPSKWSLEGAQAVSGGVQLTPKDQSGAVSGIWTKTAMSLGRSLHVTVTFTDTVPSGASDGDGIAVAWASSPGLGGSDKELGICAPPSMTGVASLLYTESPQHLQVATALGPNVCATFGSVPADIAATGTVELLIEGSAVTATAGGSTQTETSAGVPPTGYVGVTASTGDVERSGFTVTSIKIESCP